MLAISHQSSVSFPANRYLWAALLFSTEGHVVEFCSGQILLTVWMLAFIILSIESSKLPQDINSIMKAVYMKYKASCVRKACFGYVIHLTLFLGMFANQTCIHKYKVRDIMIILLSELLYFLSSILNPYLYSFLLSPTLFFFFVVTEIKPRTSCMLGKCSVTKLHSQPLCL